MKMWLNFLMLSKFVQVNRKAKASLNIGNKYFVLQILSSPSCEEIEHYIRELQNLTDQKQLARNKSGKIKVAMSH